MWALNPMTGILIRKRRGSYKTQRQKEEDHVQTEAETGVVLPKLKNARRPQKLKEARKDSLPEP